MQASSHSTIESHIEEISSRTYRHAALHWTAFVLSLASLGILGAWLAGPRDAVPMVWLAADIGLGAIFAIEFFSRSGFRWSPAQYVRTRFFDFIAIVPALALVQHNLPGESIWIWIILAARAIRIIDRFLGDGFIRRNVLALIEGFEEEITDRVLLRIVARVQADLDRGSLTQALAEALSRNKSTVLERIRAEHPKNGLGPGFARLIGLDKTLEHWEERSFDSLINIVASREVDNAIHDAIDSAFSTIREQVEVKTWRQQLGLGRRRPIQKEKARPELI